MQSIAQTMPRLPTHAKVLLLFVVWTAVVVALFKAEQQGNTPAFKTRPLLDALLICQYDTGPKDLTLTLSNVGARETVRVVGQCKNGTTIIKNVPNEDSK